MAYSTPARPAKAAPRAKVNEITRSTLMPISRAVGLSTADARMALPILVRRTRNCSSTCMSSEVATMMTKMLEKVMAPSGGAWPLSSRWMPSLMYQVTTSNGRWYGMKRGEKTKYSAPKYSRKKDTPMAVIRAAMRGALRSGLYATRSMTIARTAHTTIDSSDDRTRRRRPWRASPAEPGTRRAEPQVQLKRDTAKKLTKAPTMNTSPWAKLIRRTMPYTIV